jgi:hypothetical protein
MTKASTFYKRNYTNGYQAKVEYWSTELAIYTKYEAQDKMLIAKKKLDYFVDKQIEYLNKKQHDLLAERIGVVSQDGFEIKTIQK